ncbi:MAG: dihydrodipicolinate synthase family protein [Acidobacteriota bacterium]
MSFFSGVFVAVLTPFNAQSEFKADSYEKFIGHLFDRGVHGLYVCGVAGEGLLMSPEEREEVAEVAITASRGRGKVIIHVGSGNTRDSVRLAKHASSIGAAAVGCLPPHIGNYGIASLIEHYRRVAEAACPLPLFVYYSPQVAPSLGNFGLLERLLDMKEISGLKFTGTDASELAYAIYERSRRQTVLIGVDEMFMASLLMGAQGAIAALANIVPGLFVQIYEAAKSQCWSEANELQRRLVQVGRIVERYPFLSGLKTVAGWQGYELGEPRPPNLVLSSSERLALREALEPLGVIS